MSSHLVAHKKMTFDDPADEILRRHINNEEDGA